MESGTQLTLPGLDPTMFQKPIVTVSDFLVRLSVLLETDEALKMHEELYFLKSCGLLKRDSLKYYSRKTLLDFSTTEGGVTFDVIINTMADLGYFVEWQVLNSRYFGVPQNRERVFIVGHLGDRSGRQVFPIATDYPKTNELQGQRNSVVANCLDTRIDGDTRGTYPISVGGYLKVNGYHKSSLPEHSNTNDHDCPM